MTPFLASVLRACTANNHSQMQTSTSWRRLPAPLPTMIFGPPRIACWCCQCLLSRFYVFLLMGQLRLGCILGGVTGQDSTCSAFAGIPAAAALATFTIASTPAVTPKGLRQLPRAGNQVCHPPTMLHFRKLELANLIGGYLSCRACLPILLPHDRP